MRPHRSRRLHFFQRANRHHSRFRIHKRTVHPLLL